MRLEYFDMIDSVVAFEPGEKRITTLTVSAAPMITSAATDNHSHHDSANTMVAMPNTMTA